MKTRLATAFFLLYSYCSAHAQGDRGITDSLRGMVLTPAEMQSDFRYLRQALEETHPGLYRYNTREGIRREMDSLFAALDRPMGLYEFYGLLARLISDIHCAHTTIFPRKNLGRLFSSFQLFPFGLMYINHRAHLFFNGSPDTVVKPGFELLSINGRSIDTITSIIFRHLWGDGYIETWKPRMLVDAFFPVFYYLFVEQPDRFHFVCRNDRGEEYEKDVAAVPGKDLDRLMKKNPVNAVLYKAWGPGSRLNQAHGWRVEMRKEYDAAVMTIRGFGGGGTGDAAAKKMHDFLEQSLKKVQDNKVTNLIIDLRDNRGGWDNMGEMLYTYLIDTPSYYYRHFHTVTDSSYFLQFSSVSKEELANIKNELIHEPDGTFTIKEEYNNTLAKQFPQKNHFTGKVFFLVNGGTASSAAEFAAVAYSHRVGIFVGEETAGNYTGGNGGESISLTLPHSGFEVMIPLLFYENEVTAPAVIGRGTIPDYVVPYNVKDVLSGKDVQLEFVLGLIEGKAN
jgi:hypothetical protein